MRLDEIGMGMAKSVSGDSTDYLIQEYYALFEPDREMYVSFESKRSEGESDRNAWKLRFTATPQASGMGNTAEEAQAKLDKYRSLAGGEKYTQKQEQQIRRMERDIAKINKKYEGRNRMPTQEDKKYLKYYKGQVRNARRNITMAERTMLEIENVSVVHVQETHTVTPV